MIIYHDLCIHAVKSCILHNKGSKSRLIDTLGFQWIEHLILKLRSTKFLYLCVFIIPCIQLKQQCKCQKQYQHNISSGSLHLIPLFSVPCRRFRTHKLIKICLDHTIIKFTVLIRFSSNIFWCILKGCDHIQ